MAGQPASVQALLHGVWEMSYTLKLGAETIIPKVPSGLTHTSLALTPMPASAATGQERLGVGALKELGNLWFPLRVLQTHLLTRASLFSCTFSEDSVSRPHKPGPLLPPNKAV